MAQDKPNKRSHRQPTVADACWAFDYLPMLYDLAFTLEAKGMDDAYRLASELCYEIDRLYVTHNHRLQNSASRAGARV